MDVMPMNVLFNIIGLAGAGTLLFAFFLQQKGAVTANSPRYLWLNFFGAVAIIVSLLKNWNLASFLLECAWLSISVYGLVKARRQGIV